MSDKKATVKDVLKILGISAIVISSIALPNIAIAYNSLDKAWKKYKRGDLGRIIKRLHKQQVIKISEKNGETILEISEKGKKKLLKYDFDSLVLSKHRDGKLRVVSFDIPNSKKLARDIFRKKLKELQFKQVQKSIFITAYPCKKEIQFVVNLLGISDYVMVFQLGSIELGTEYKFKKLDYIN